MMAADSICTTNRFNQDAIILGHIWSESKHAHLSLRIKKMSANKIEVSRIKVGNSTELNLIVDYSFMTCTFLWHATTCIGSLSYATYLQTRFNLQHFCVKLMNPDVTCLQVYIHI